MLAACFEEQFFLDTFLYERHHVAQRHIYACARGTRYQFHLACGSLFAHIDSIGNAHQVCVFEFDAGTLVAVIKQHIEACGFELGSQLFARLKQQLVGDIRDGNNH